MLAECYSKVPEKSQESSIPYKNNIHKIVTFKFV